MINRSAAEYMYRANLNRGVDLENKQGTCKRFPTGISDSHRRADRLTNGRPGKWLPHLPDSYSSSQE